MITKLSAYRRPSSLPVDAGIISDLSCVVEALRQAAEFPEKEAKVAVASILSDAATRMAAIRDEFPNARADRPTRYRIYQDERFSLSLLAWRPGQVGRLQGQFTWSAHVVLRGELIESDFAMRCDPAQSPSGLQIMDCRIKLQASLSLAEADEVRAFRLANLGVRPALSLHFEAVPAVPRASKPFELTRGATENLPLHLRRIK